MRNYMRGRHARKIENISNKSQSFTCETPNSYAKKP